ncbi:hypothetical protein DSL72_004468 [Monilinia vaccinii-corymbosi]|uniref:Tubulin-specific chaperone D C-terminal domain-containing protein n=1 Tax=Monilinia vaccinii-corymbosi TaxID=61207 RepID=A0A8A3P0K7_9HELO|nr:hypothetical protein DSL72_004468 [Monilinia vaccinii-corymbosi]
MDAAEDDRDILLQRESGELLEDFEKSLHPFLYNVTNNARLRRRVRIKETERLTALLDNFQELPQLLDTHLPRLVPTLANALLASISKSLPQSSTPHTRLLIPLRRAICQLLYTFCKVRGEKVIVQCLSPENKHIDVLLSALEKGTSVKNDVSEEALDELWGWEERYITLLWLSHLIIAPFDLQSLSSHSSSPGGIVSFLPGLDLPVNVPDVPSRSVSLALRYLSSPGKEKDSAKTLLVRVVLRKDMQELGLLRSLVMWSISALHSIDTSRNIHHINGVLSFLSGVLRSSMDTAYMDPYLELIFRAVQNIMDPSHPSCAEIQNSAVSRKLTIKIFRSIALLNLRPSFTTIDDILNDSVDFVLEMLSNPSTPVRLAASKALSVIILKIQPEFASQLVSVILEMLKETDTDAFTWHGQILTLSHLLYRHAAPRDVLDKVIALVLKALSYERKSISGSSIGTNVRDAANFGIWSLARRYSTAELQDVNIKCEEFNYSSETRSTIQILATHLVVSACLDPAGNIRRGSSAALQELIGRHPGTIIEALNLVQIVDYHAVALRSRGILEVAVSASLLSHNIHPGVYRHHYGEALLRALRGWRGIGDANIVTRRNCAEAFHRINFSREENRSTTYENSYDTIMSLDQQLEKLHERQTSERHGLLLFISAAILEYPFPYTGALKTPSSREPVILQSSRILEIINKYLQQITQGKFYRSELIAEALCCMVFHSFRLYGMCAMVALENASRLSAVGDLFTWLSNSKTRNVLMFEEESNAERMITETLEGLDTTGRPGMMEKALTDLSHDSLLMSDDGNRFWTLARDFVDKVLDIDLEVVALWSACARRFYFWSSSEHRRSLIDSWLDRIRHSMMRTEVDIKRDRLMISGAWIAYSLDPEYRDEICDAIHSKWKTTVEISYNLEIRIALCACLAKDIKVPASQIIRFWDIISDGLDDYHTDKVQGDTGSRVRLEAIKGAAILLSSGLEWNHANEKVFSTIFGKLLRLCSERLDKVRAEAKKAILSILVSSPETLSFEQSSVSSYEHFRFILDLQTTDRQIIKILNFQWPPLWTERLLEGYVTSAHGGSEDLIRVSRAALIDFCEKDPKNREHIGPALVKNLETHYSKNDRVIIPTLEIIALLLDMELMYNHYNATQYRKLYNQIVKEAFKSTEIPKLLAAAKCYGRLALSYPNAIDRLLTLLWHYYPKVRVAAVDELWDLGITCVKGKDCKFMKSKKLVLGIEDDPSKFAEELYKQCANLGFKDGDILERLGKFFT